MFRPLLIRCAWICLINLSIACPSNGLPILFTLDTGVTVVNPVLNESLQVGYVGDGPGGDGVYRYQSGTYTSIFSSSDSRVNGFVRGGVSMNDLGAIAFDYYRLSGSGLNIHISEWRAFKGDESSVSQFASVGPVPQGSSVGSLSSQAINNSGDIVYTLPGGVQLLPGGAVTSMSLGAGSKATINNAGQIAYVSAGNGLILRETDGSSSVVNPSGLATNAAGPDLSESGEALAVLATGGAQSYGDLTPGFVPFPAGRLTVAAVNNLDQYLLLTSQTISLPFGGSVTIKTLGAFEESTGLYTEYLRTNDPFLGSTIKELYVSNGGLNDSGQFAFGYALQDGRNGIAVAAVPEATSLFLATATFTLIGGLRFRTWSTRRAMKH